MQWSATSHIPPSTPCTTVHHPSLLQVLQPQVQNGAKVAACQIPKTTPGVAAVAQVRGEVDSAETWKHCPARALAI